MKTPHNYKTVTMKLKRIDVCNLLLATSILSDGEDRKHWKELHDKIKATLDDFDEKNPIEE